jgi:hypothetical protein
MAGPASSRLNRQGNERGEALLYRAPRVWGAVKTSMPLGKAAPQASQLIGRG